MKLANINCKRIKIIFLNFLVVSFTLILSLVVFFGFDYYLSINKNPLQEFDYGWYELKKNYDGFDQWGGNRYQVKSDQYGFRVNPNVSKFDKAEYLFLGDSFTFGINGAWEETFVGMFDGFTKKTIINAGVSSYSPTPYLYQYQKALALNLLSSNHVVVVGIDVSDVQDEASLWIDGLHHPIKRDHLNDYINVFNFKSYLRYNFKITYTIGLMIWRTINPRDEIFLQEKMSVRSAFTWDDWSKLDSKIPSEGVGGYAPLGVAGGLQSIHLKVKQITDIAKKNNSKVYLLVYPWPNQIIYKQKFSWSGYANKLCIEVGCSGVIDAQPLFFEYAKAHKKWYEDLFLVGDIHYNVNGNKLVFEALKNYLGD